MNLFNKVFSGGQIDKQIAPDLSTSHIADLRDDPLLPLHGLAAGEEATIPKFHQATLDSNKAIHQALEQEFGNLDAYENLQSKLNVSELSVIYSTLESISNTVNSLNQSNPSSDDHLENWHPLMANIDAFVAKKKQLQSIEKQMKQTISEMQDLHQKMIDSIAIVRDYNSERAQMYLERKKIADELGRKLL
jgi:hypothetical protein